MKTKPTRYELGLNNLPPFNQQQRAEIEALKAMREETINYGDIPMLPDDRWKTAVPNPTYRPTKALTTVRLDSDVLLWLKSKGKGVDSKVKCNTAGLMNEV